MTSQHFNTVDGWTEDWGDWGENPNAPVIGNNNNSTNNPNVQPFSNPQMYPPPVAPLHSQNPYSLQSTFTNASSVPVHSSSNSGNDNAYSTAPPPPPMSQAGAYNQYAAPAPVDYSSMSQPAYNPTAANMVYQEDKSYPLPPPPDNFGMAGMDYMMNQQQNLPDPPINDVSYRSAQLDVQKPQAFPAAADILDSFSNHQPFDMFSTVSKSSFTEKSESAQEPSAYLAALPQSEQRQAENTLYHPVESVTLESNESNPAVQDVSASISSPQQDAHSIVNTDRDNYIVTGQLSSQDIQQQSPNFPPPGLSRMVVGQNENNSEQVQYQTQEIHMLGINQRMVTGIEDTSPTYNNFQRQVDGENAQSSHQPIRPPSVPSPAPMQGNFQREIDGEVADNEQPAVSVSTAQPAPIEVGNFMNYQRQADGEVSSDPSTRSPTVNDHATVDRSSYFVTGGTETQPDSQRFVPGLESENITTQMHGLQTSQDSHSYEMNMSHMSNRDNEVEGIDVTSREEDIDGANENSETSNTISDKHEKDTNTRDGVIVGNVKAGSSKKTTLDTSEDEKELQELEANNSKTRPKERHKRNESYESDSYRSRDKPSRDEYDKRDRHAHGSEPRKKNDDSDEYRKKEKKRTSRSKKYSDNDEYESERGTRRFRDKDGREKTRRSKDYYDDDRRRRERRSYGDRERDRERDREQRGQQYGYYGNYPGYDQYGSYNPYAQLEHLRRTNPQAYYEWYTKYYAGMMQQNSMQHQQDVMSLHSGYSSSNEKDKPSMSKFQHGGPVSQHAFPNMMTSSMIDGSECNSLRDFAMGNNSFQYDANYKFDREKFNQEKQRLTPKKFECLHNFVGLSHGLLSAKDTTVTIQNVHIMDKTRKTYQSYPGPLVRETSHKKTIIEFCEEKLSLRSLHKPFEASYSLIWSFLILMIRQNGNYTEGDISELLMKNSEEFKSALETKQETNSEDDKQSREGNDESENELSSNENSSAVVTQSYDSEEVVIHKFREYLLYGNIGDALDFATDNNLWGHALFLASKVDKRQHANVMLKFANKLPYNDPLQTLYQTMSGRTPACVTHLDDKWGDWRPHLAMIISNCKDKPDLVKKSIITLGDSLLNRGDLFGSHFCYLIAEPTFGEYTAPNAKIVLIGASQKQSFNEFATDDAIMMTEIFEYAISLSHPAFNINSLANFKFLMASRMLDYGFPLKALLYMEEMANQIIKRPECFDKDFMLKVYTLADRLKFYDPVIAKSYEDNYNNNDGGAAENQKWLQDLWQILSSNSYEQNVDDYQSQQPVQYYDQQQSQPVQSEYVPAVDDYSPSVTNQYQPSTPIHAPTISASHQEQYEPPSIPVVESQPMENYSQEYQPTMYGQDVNQNQSEMINQSATSEYTGYGYDYSAQYSNQQQQPTISLGNTVASKYTDENDAPTQGNGQKANATAKPKQSPEKSNKKAQDEANNTRWFNGIFSKLSIKPKNQMILPDDKNPTIVWDESTKKWVNKDETATESEAFRPPPKMDFPQMPMQPPQQSAPEISNHMPAAMPNQPNQPNPMQPMSQMANNGFVPNSGEQTQMPKVEPPSQNMFKMQKGRNIKKSYVNLLSNSGQTVAAKEIAADVQQTLFAPISQQQPQSMQFYNPNNFQ